MTIHFTLTGPSEPWWLTYAVGVPLGVLIGWIITRRT